MVLDRYIANAVISGAFVAMLVLGSLFTFVEFVGELKEIGKTGYGLIQAIYFVALSLPQKLYELAPSVILLGGLISLGTMASNSELVVMRASGISSSRIIRSVLQAGLLLAAIIAVAGEYLVPYTTIKGNAMRATAMGEQVFVGGANDLWARDNNRYINVQKLLPDMQLRDITVYELDEKRRLKRSTHAGSAMFEKNRWILFDVVHSNISTNGVTIEKHKQEEWIRLINPDVFEVLSLEPADMSATDLYQYSNYLDANELDSAQFRLAFWIKVFTPLTCLVMLLIAMPFVFSTTPRSGGTGFRVIIGITLGIAFFVLSRTINHLGIVYSIEPVISAVLPLLIVVSIITVLMRRIR